MKISSFQMCVRLHPLLGVYLWLMLGNGPSAGFHLSEAWPALLVVVMPLMAAAVSERWFESRPERTHIRDKLA